ncbi:hypothetical protein BGZ83_010875 [Gryganskiella cystojenkinii]|nr:hypothetical protein BGZ83_010875 [Gryganskiella cystojenkinii]
MDVEFQELNSKFTASEAHVALLVTETCKFRDNITAILNHQAEFGIILQDIYDPSIGMPAGEVTPRRAPTAPESTKAVDDFQATMRETRDILLPLVDRLEMTVVRPLTELQNNMKLIRKTIIKRDHKLVDYDRFRISLKKLQDKKERTLSDEKSIYKLESQLEVATADYEGLNGLLREELPGFFYYRTQLMEPVFHAFYFLQLQIYNILLERIEPLSRCGYFNLTMDVLSGYETRKHEIGPTIESVELITKKSVTATYQSKYGRPSHDAAPPAEGAYGAPSYGAPDHTHAAPAAKPWEAAAASVPSAPGVKPWQTGRAVAGAKPWQTGGHAVPAAGSKTWQTGAATVASSSAPPPAYNAEATAPAPPGPAANSRFGAPQNLNIHLAPSISGTIAATAAAAATSHAINSFNNGMRDMQTQAAAHKGPPPPIPKRIGGGAPTAVALYDYDAQQEGDLSFRKDDRIEIVQRGANANEWWTGKLNGRQGVFPGNYVQEI